MMKKQLVIYSVALLSLVSNTSTAQIETHESSSNRFGLAEPSWFLAGFGTQDRGSVGDVFTDPENQMKFHFALRVHLIPVGEYADGLHVSFAQTSFWDPYVRYAPALDNTYTPEVFLYWDWGAEKRGESYSRWKPSWRLSYTHESNGLGGDDSRTWNRYILRAEFGDALHDQVFWWVSGWVSFNDHDNPDITEHLGSGELVLNWQPLKKKHPDGIRVLGLRIKTMWGVGGRFLKNVQVDGYFHPLLLSRKLVWMPTFMVQYFAGRGESIMKYDRDTHAIRAGIVLFP